MAAVTAHTASTRRWWLLGGITGLAVIAIGMVIMLRRRRSADHAAAFRTTPGPEAD